MKKPKVKVLTFGMTSIVGGIETFLINLYENINLDTVQMDFLVPGKLEGEYRERIEKRNGKIYEIDKIKRHPIKVYKQVKEIYNKEKYDILHVNLCNAFYFIYMLPIIFCSKKKVKIICHSHNGSDKHKILHYFTKGILNHYCTQFVTCSDKATQWMYTKRKIKKNEVLMINNAIDTDKFIYNEEIRKKIRNKYNIKDEFIVGHVGRFEEQKNHTFLIDIFKNLTEEQENVKLLLAGTGTLEDSIKEKVKNLHLEDKVIFCGVCSNINEIYQAMDIFVLPSIFEGLPISGIEAQASGLKCLFADTISKKSDITGNVQFLPIKETKIWVQQIKGSINNKYERKNMKGKVQKSNYDMKTEVKKIEKLYLM